MNKLSELSKPVAYDYQYAGVETCEGFGSWRNELTWDCPPDWMVETGKVKNLKPRYSQEYVSALLAERDAFEGAALALRDELRASQAIANEYQQLMYHMDAGGDFFEFQRDKSNG